MVVIAAAVNGKIATRLAVNPEPRRGNGHPRFEIGCAHVNELFGAKCFVLVIAAKTDAEDPHYHKDAWIVRDVNHGGVYSGVSP